MSSRHSVLFVTTLSSFLTPFMGSAINVALPRMGSELGMNTIELGWVSTAYLLAAAIFLLPFGRLADNLGRKRFFIGGLVVFILAALASAIAGDKVTLITARVVNGAGGALLYATAVAILTSAYPKAERGKVLGINVASVYLGLSLGPTIGGVLTSSLGWRSIFAFIAILGIITLPIAIRHLKTDHKPSGTGTFDLKGSLVYGISLALIIYGFPKLPGFEGLLPFGLGIAGFFLFVRIENHTASPLLEMNVFKGNQVFIFSNLAAFINYSATFALVFLLSFYLQQVRGLPPAQTGLILMAQPVVMTLLSPLAGRLSDRIEPAIVASAGMGLTVIGLGAFAFLDAGSSLSFIIILQMILGLGFALFSSPNTNAVMSSVNPSHYGVASATLGTMRLTGQTVSMGISMLMFALIMGKGSSGIENTEGLLSSIRYAFIVFALISVAGTFFSMKRGKIRT
ncbi:MAG TPA: MFS transporter [Lentimicrobium sp.]|nr:MFS transporter [Lentimicrobium sp.]